MNLHAVRQAGSVHRWHTTPKMLRVQTVADHCWNVVMLLLHVYPSASGQLLRAALRHDNAELITGDMPAPAKWFNRNLADELKVVEEKVNAIFKYPADFNAELSVPEKTALKWADGAELVLFCLEDGRMGNRTAHRPAWSVLRRMASMHGLNRAMLDTNTDMIESYKRVFNVSTFRMLETEFRDAQYYFEEEVKGE